MNDFSGRTISDGLGHRRHELLELIGKGGEAPVYKARALDDPETEGFRAVKVFELGTQDPVAQMHQRMLERGGYRNLPRSHANLVEFIDLFNRSSPDGRPGPTERQYQYLVMAFVPGERYSRYLKVVRGDLSPLASAATGLAALHSIEGTPLVHGDVKPSNILVYTEPGIGSVGCMVDLGNARIIGTAGAPIGSAQFSSPRFFTEPAHPRFDAYSLALVALSALDPQVSPATADEIFDRLRTRSISELAVERIGGALHYEIPEGTPIDEWFAPLAEEHNITAPRDTRAADPGEKTEPWDPTRDAEGAEAGASSTDPDDAARGNADGGARTDPGASVPGPDGTDGDAKTRVQEPTRVMTTPMGHAAPEDPAALAAQLGWKFQLLFWLCDNLIFALTILGAAIIGLFAGLILKGL